MKHLALAACLTLAGCATLPIPVSPSVIADRTTLDETTGIRATRAYTALSRSGAALVRLGVLDRDRFKAADQKGYTAVLELRRAYDAGNATSYDAAVTDTYAAIDLIGSMVK